MTTVTETVCIVCDGLVGCEFCPRGWVPQDPGRVRSVEFVDGRVESVELFVEPVLGDPSTYARIARAEADRG